MFRRAHCTSSLYGGNDSSMARPYRAVMMRRSSNVIRPWSPDPRHFEARDVGDARRRCIVALALDAIGPVDPRCLNPDQDLAWAGFRHRSGRGIQDLRPAGLGDFDAGHGIGNSGV